MLHAGCFASEIQERITDERVQRLPDGIGAIDQIGHAGAPLEDIRWRRILRAVYASTS